VVAEVILLQSGGVGARSKRWPGLSGRFFGLRKWSFCGGVLVAPGGNDSGEPVGASNTIFHYAASLSAAFLK